MSNEPGALCPETEVWPLRDRLLFYGLRGLAAVIILAALVVAFFWPIPSMPLKLQSFLCGAIACIGWLAYAVSSRFQRRSAVAAPPGGK